MRAPRGRSAGLARDPSIAVFPGRVGRWPAQRGSARLPPPGRPEPRPGRVPLRHAPPLQAVAGDAPAQDRNGRRAGPIIKPTMAARTCAADAVGAVSPGSRRDPTRRVTAVPVGVPAATRAWPRWNAPSSPFQRTSAHTGPAPGRSRRVLGEQGHHRAPLGPFPGQTALHRVRRRSPRQHSPGHGRGPDRQHDPGLQSIAAAPQRIAPPPPPHTPGPRNAVIDGNHSSMASLLTQRSPRPHLHTRAGRPLLSRRPTGPRRGGGRGTRSRIAATSPTNPGTRRSPRRQHGCRLREQRSEVSVSAGVQTDPCLEHRRFGGGRHGRRTAHRGHAQGTLHRATARRRLGVRRESVLQRTGGLLGRHRHPGRHPASAGRRDSTHWGPSVFHSDDLGRTWTEPTRPAVKFPKDTGASLERVWQLHRRQRSRT